MSKYRIGTENGDILFYGTPSNARPTYRDGFVVDFVGSPQQHVELTAHLNRHAYNWNFTDRRNFTEGLVTYHLSSYFTITEVEDEASENDAAVGRKRDNPAHPELCACNAASVGKTYINGPKSHRTTCPDQPTFPADNTPDPYTRIIDVNFAYEGERFRAEYSLPGGKKQIRYGTFAMDGHAVSPNYGWLSYPDAPDTAAAKLKAFGPDSGKQYINVHFDDVPAGYYDAAVKREPKRGNTPAVDYVPSGAGWPNDGLHPDQIGLKIYGLPEVADRKQKVLKQIEAERKQRTAEKRLADAKAELAAAEKALRDLP